MFRRAVLVAIAAIALIPTAAQAVIFTGVNDPNDTPGKLDLARVEGVRTVSGGDIVYKVKFQDSVVATTLIPASNWVKIFVDVDTDPSVDYTGTIKGTKNGRFWIWWAGEGNNYDAIRMKHPNSRTLSYTAPGGEFLAPNGPVGMKVLSAYYSKRCYSVCIDWAPNSGEWIML
jgi:hypothetical protein